MDVESLQLPRAGVCLHITSLPGHNGIGELGDNALRFVLTLEALGFGIWQVLPTGPTGYGDSPYQLQSTYAGNEMLIDVGELVKAGFLEGTETRPLAELSADVVDFGALLPLKKALLQTAAGRFADALTDEQPDEFHAFVEQHDARWLHDYAIYRVLKQRHAERPWYEWPAEFAQRDSDALAQIVAEEAAAIQAVKVLQFWFRQQWDRLHTYAEKHGVQLLGDMPFYIAHDSADAWAHPELLLLDAAGQPLQVAGVPPDYFSADGQLWGNPVYDWSRHAETGYDWWVDRVSYALSLTDWLRIDHFRGFEAYWSVAADATTARDGAWVPGPGAALFSRLQSALGLLPIVAEDLGVITPPVEALRTQLNLPGMQVLQFEIDDPDFEPAQLQPHNILYTGTHDNDTVRGWLNGGPGDVRSAAEIKSARKVVLKLTGGTIDTAHLDLLQLALKSPCRAVIVPMQDLLGLDSAARLNTPGTAEGNWGWRLLPDALTPESSEQIRGMLRATQRVSAGR